MGIIKIIDTIYDVKGMMPEDARKNNVDIKIKDGALDKKEFLALWKKINVKSIYAVDFEGQELVDNAIEALNSKLEVSKIYVKITEGTMKSIDSKQALIDGKAFETKPSQSKMEVISSSGTNIKYDLVGKLSLFPKRDIFNSPSSLFSNIDVKVCNSLSESDNLNFSSMFSIIFNITNDFPLSKLAKKSSILIFLPSLSL